MHPLMQLHAKIFKSNLGAIGHFDIIGINPILVFHEPDSSADFLFYNHNSICWYAHNECSLVAASVGGNSRSKLLLPIEILVKI